MPSQLLQDLATRIGTALAAGPDLRLDEATLGIPGLGPLVQAATGVAGLAISAASLDVEDDSLTVSGSSLRPITLSVRDDGGAVLRLEVSAFDAPVPLSGLVPSLLHGGFSVPARLGGVKVVSLSATLRPAAQSVALALLGADETAIGGLLQLERPSLNLQAAGLDGTSPVVRAALESLATIAGAPFRVKGEFGGPGGFSVVPVGGPTPGIRSLLEAILGAFPAGLPELPTGPLAFDADLASDTYGLRIPLTGVWTIPLGVATLAVSEVVIAAVQDTAGLSGRLAGRCSLAGQTIDIQARLPGDFVLSGRLASINLTNLVTDLCGPVLTLPGGFPAIILPTSDLTLAAGIARRASRSTRTWLTWARLLSSSRRPGPISVRRPDSPCRTTGSSRRSRPCSPRSTR